MAGLTDKVLGAVGGAIALIIIVVALFAMTPTIIEQEEDVTSDASTWNFTGAEGAESLLGLSPFVWVGGVIIAVVVGAFLIAKSLGSTS
jgi:hypothetical protein